MIAPAATDTRTPAKRIEDASRLSLATLMLVDDDATSMAATLASLEAAGYAEIVTCGDPAQAESLLASHEPDILLLAHHPGLAAPDLLSQLRAGEPWRHLPVIVLVAVDDPAGKHQALQAGATEILSTPPDTSELVLRLRHSLGLKAYEDRLLKQDALTGLANRGEFMRRVQAVLEKSLQAGNAPAAGSADTVGRCLILFNLDRFKQINDSIGHDGGDEVLRLMAQRLIAVVSRHAGGNRRADGGRLTPWLARSEGDRFMALLPGGAGSERHRAAMEHLVAAISAPIHVNRREFHVGASIGVAAFPSDGDSVELLVQRAELAVIQAKKRGGSAIEYFNPEMQTQAAEQLTLENQLRYAVRRGELRLYYQPKVACADLRIVGVEALMRWQHPEHGLISPQRFIPLAEEAGLIDEIGEWALGEACRQGAQWLSADLPPVHIAVNLSATQLLQAGLAADVARILAHSGFPAARLTLELTESVLMTAGDNAARTIDALKAIGVALSLDDFGTGFSPLTYLRRLPIDEIKIDRSFVQGLPAQPEGAAIAGAIIALGGALGLRVVAEGVESEAELGFLRRYSHCLFQGDLFSKPVPGDQLADLLRAMPR